MPIATGQHTDPMTLDEIRALAADDLKAVDHCIAERLASDVVLINELGRYIVHSGGKRLRPLTVLLAARASGYTGTEHHLLAAVVEFIHTATLLHDDVVDGSSMRRGRETANNIWGNEASVLVGDFLYSRSFEMMVELQRMPVMAVMARTTNTIARGEVMQLMNCNDPDLTEADYREVIYRKTATLFEAGCHLGGILGELGDPAIDGLQRYGRHLGTAYQLVDDALDYSGDPDEIGKNLGDDLSEGKATLPLIHAMAEGAPEDAELIREAIREGGLSRIDAVQEAIEKTRSAAYTRRLAEQEVDQALHSISGALPESPWRQALEDLARFCVGRTA